MPCSHGGDVSRNEEIGDAGGFPNPKLYAGACLDLDDHPSFEEDEAGSSQWPPREKMWRWIVDKWRPSGHRSPLVEGGLRSLTKKPRQFSRTGWHIQNAQRQIRDGLNKESKKTLYKAHTGWYLGKKILLG